MEYWFTADTHFGHENIIKYIKRPFRNCEEMDNAMIRNWNSRVKKDDVVFHLGDFCFKNTKNRGEGNSHHADYYMNKLNGKIILVSGNHDKNNTAKSCIESITIALGGMEILLTHKPTFGCASHDLFLCGHVHSLWKSSLGGDSCPLTINVGVDVWGFTPINIETIKRYKHKVEQDAKVTHTQGQEWGVGMLETIRDGITANPLRLGVEPANKKAGLNFPLFNEAK